MLPNRQPAPILPPELLLFIFSLACPSTTLFHLRALTLKSCALVHSTWRDPAQRELLRRVSVSAPEGIAKLQSTLLEELEGSEMTDWVEELEVTGEHQQHGYWGVESPFQIVRRVMGLCKKVAVLCLKNVHGLIFEDLVGNEELRAVSAESCTFLDTPAPTLSVASNIERLNLNSCQAPSASRSPFNSTTLPHLRALSITSGIFAERAPAYKGRARAAGPICTTQRDPNIARTLLSSLSALSVDAEHYPNILAPAITTQTPLKNLRLLDLSGVHTLSFLHTHTTLRFLRINASSQQLTELTAELREDKKTISKLIAVSISRRPDQQEPDLTFTSRECRDLTKELKKKGIVFEWEQGQQKKKGWKKKDDRHFETGFWKFLSMVEDGRFGSGGLEA